MFWSTMAALSTSVWAILLQSATVNEILLAFFITGIVFGTILFTNEKNGFQDVTLFRVILLSVVLGVYQILLHFAFSKEGARAQAIVNMNVIFITLINVAQSQDTWISIQHFNWLKIALSTLYIFIGLIISDYIPIKKLKLY